MKMKNFGAAALITILTYHGFSKIGYGADTPFVKEQLRNVTDRAKSAQKSGLCAKTWKFAAVGDTQNPMPWSHFGERSWNCIADAMKNAGVEFVLHLGDISYMNNRYQYEQFFETVDRTKLIVLPTPGNHDMSRSGQEHWQKRFGDAEYDFRFCQLNFVSWQSDRSGLGLREPEETRIRRLRPDVLYAHIPPEKPWTLHTFAHRAPEFHQMVRDLAPKLVFFGHLHKFDDTYKTDKTQWIISGGGGGFPWPPWEEHHWMLMTVDPQNQISYQKIPVDPKCATLSTK